MRLLGRLFQNKKVISDYYNFSIKLFIILFYFTLNNPQTKNKTKINEVSLSKILMPLENSKEIIEWTCLKCTYINATIDDTDSKICEVCAFQNVAEQVTNNSLNINWKCGKCMYSNENSNNKCDVCGNKKIQIKIKNDHSFFKSVLHQNEPIKCRVYSSSYEWRCLDNKQRKRQLTKEIKNKISLLSTPSYQLSGSKCKNCKSVNYNKNESCNFCSRKPINTEGLLDSIKNEKGSSHGVCIYRGNWECKKCTYINSSLSYKCEVCMNTYEEGKIVNNKYDENYVIRAYILSKKTSISIKIDGEWICKACNYENHETTTCIVCGKTN